MLAEAAGIKKIVLAVGYTDLRKSIDGLAQLIGTKYDLNPFERDVLFLFCGRRSDRIKGLVWGGTVFFYCTNVWRTVLSPGRGLRKRLPNLPQNSTGC